MEDRARAPEYVVNWPAVIGGAVLAVLIGLGTLAAGLWKPTSLREVELEPVVRMAVVRESTSDTPRPVVAPVVVQDEPQEVFRTRSIRREMPMPAPSATNPAVDPLREARQLLAKGTIVWNRILDEAQETEVARREARFERLQVKSEVQLREDLLALAKELKPEKPVRNEAQAKPAAEDPNALPPKPVRGKPAAPETLDNKANLERLMARSDLAGVPFVGADDCTSNKSEARGLAIVSSEVRRADATRANRATRGRNTSSTSSTSESTSEYADHLYADLPMHELLEAKRKTWQGEEYVGGLAQTMQVEGRGLRTALLAHLAKTPGPKASRAVAARAVFDLDPVVRQEAIQVLSKRPAKEYREELLAALRYPWRVPAEHAAEALVAVEDRQAVADLIELLDAPDPTVARLNAKREWVVPELTKVNHLRNCMLCHPASAPEPRNAIGAIPVEGKALPVFYYQDRSPGSEFVRADVTYLRQDFSVMEGLEKQEPWPAVQRMDFFVRERKATDKEIEWAKTVSNEGVSWYPQREAVLFALRGLTGEWLGESSQLWREKFRG